jgi:hypothetical protein
MPVTPALGRLRQNPKFKASREGGGGREKERGRERERERESPCVKKKKKKKPRTSLKKCQPCHF